MDAEIAGLISLLNRLRGVSTICSCSGRASNDPRVVATPFVALRPNGEGYAESVQRLIDSINQNRRALLCEIKVEADLGTRGHQIRLAPMADFGFIARTWKHLEAIVKELVA